MPNAVVREELSMSERGRGEGFIERMAARHYGALLDGAGAGIASRLDAFEVKQDHNREVQQ